MKISQRESSQILKVIFWSKIQYFSFISLSLFLFVLQHWVYVVTNLSHDDEISCSTPGWCEIEMRLPDPTYKRANVYIKCANIVRRKWRTFSSRFGCNGKDIFVDLSDKTTTRFFPMAIQNFHSTHILFTYLLVNLFSSRSGIHFRCLCDSFCYNREWLVKVKELNRESWHSSTT